MNKYQVKKNVFFVHFGRDEILSSSITHIIISDDSIKYNLAGYMDDFNESDLFETFEEAKTYLIDTLNKNHAMRILNIKEMTTVSY